MALIRKHTLYQLAGIAWGVVVFGVVILTISGNARPFLAPDQLPIRGPLNGIGVIAVLWFLGAGVIFQLEKRSWKRAGKEVGLSPDARGGIIGKPDLTGTVDGRDVRARTVSRNVGGGGESGSNEETFTVVETDLSDPSDQGLIVLGGKSTIGADDVPVDLAEQATTVGGVAVLGGADDVARDVLTPRAQDAIQRVDTITVHAGETADIYSNTVQEATGSIAGSLMNLMEDKLADRIPGDAGTVSPEKKGVVLNGADLERQAQAVVAVADGFEDAFGGESRA
jgi:hypothetical protein